jgi:CheY-like chemotaxis protein
MQSHGGCKILVVTSDRQNPERVRTMFPGNGAGKDILVARSYMGALEMARAEHPEVCILSQQMLMLQGRSFPDALKEACPETEIFIADDGDFANGTADAATHDS